MEQDSPSDLNNISIYYIFIKFNKYTHCVKTKVQTIHWVPHLGNQLVCYASQGVNSNIERILGHLPVLEVLQTPNIAKISITFNICHITM